DGDKTIIQDYLVNVDAADDVTIYVGKCIEDTRFSGNCESERTVDMFIVGPYAKTPRAIFLYGENRSVADSEDKTDRSGTSRVGKACDFLYLLRNHSTKKLENYLIEQSGKNPLPESLQKGMMSIFIPFYQIIGMKIRFYLLFQINGDLYGIWDWASEMFPEKDESIRENLLEWIGRITNILTEEAKEFKHKSPGGISQKSIKLNQPQSP
ncbi:15436_t:CDS:2, partial [Entrophospora sp. SA101]